MSDNQSKSSRKAALIYNQPPVSYGPLLSRRKRSKKTRQPKPDPQNYMINNYFPALENDEQLVSGEEQEQVINEVPQAEEEGEESPTSNENVNSEEVPDVELTDDQLVELLQNADKLSPEQQVSLQQIVQERWGKELAAEGQNGKINNILIGNQAMKKKGAKVKSKRADVSERS